MTGSPETIDHQHSAEFDLAFDWYWRNRDICKHPVIPAIREMFPTLSARDACGVLRAANLRSAQEC